MRSINKTKNNITRAENSSISSLLVGFNEEILLKRRKSPTKIKTMVIPLTIPGMLSPFFIFFSYF